jgi:hypothetical protein
MRMDTPQRRFIADKLMDSANYALAGLVFGQLVTNRVQPLHLLLGGLLYLWGWTIAVRLTKGVTHP